MADRGIILTEDETLHGEDCERLEQLGWLVRCPNDTLDENDPTCGFHHRGEGFYHLVEGKNINDLPVELS